MTLETFKKIIGLIQKADEEENTLFHIGVDMMSFVEKYNLIIQNFFSEIFTEESVDLIYWWLYDNVKKVLYITENNKDVEHNVESLDDLFKHLTFKGNS
jgi:hypothetical protein